MFGSILTGYVAGLLMERFPKYEKWLLVVSVASHTSILAFFKLSDSLPIGISFYTFQVVSYIIDVYRKDTTAQHSLVDFALYVSMFPQLIAGPIVRYIDIEIQLKNRTHSIANAAYGIGRFAIGLGKKVLLANNLGELCEIFRTSQDKSVLYYWMYAVGFVLHIYFDFSGYSDMAIGLGKILGFDFLENFNYPFIANSVTDFWRRWHMSLGTWFRDYVYIPLGGNRVTKSRFYFNILIVWSLTGLWHGGQWQFIVWGLYFAVFLILEKQFLLKYLKEHKIFARIYITVTILVSFVIFNARNMGEAIEYIKAMFGLQQVPLVSVEALYYLKSYAVLFGIGMLAATPVGKMVVGKYPKLRVLEPVVVALLLLTSTAFLVDGSFNPFLYFRF